uniref:Uncharacterized protein n=1 Tax=Rhizophora mucronata TaxID=61149 RepID=A0A2P2N3F7_RHIMU
MLIWDIKSYPQPLQKIQGPSYK